MFEDAGFSTSKEGLAALANLEAMSDDEFNVFFTSLPMRTQLGIRGRLVDWREVLPRWYVARIKERKEARR